jgi:large subunit ribosomal protein L25
MPSQQRARLSAEPRPQGARKSELRAMRREGMVPGSLFGHGDPQMIRLSARALNDYLRHHAPGGLMDLDLQGNTTTAIIRELDRHPVNGQIINVGLQRVDLRETIKASIPVHFTGEAEVIAEGLVLQRQLDEIEVHGRVDLLPEAVEVNLAGAAAGHTVHISDLQFPQGIEPTKPPETVVALVSAPTVAPDVEAALEAEEAAHAALHEQHAAEAEAEGEEPAAEGEGA